MIPDNVSTFVISLSECLSILAPKLALDFLNVMALEMDKNKVTQELIGYNTRAHG